jgi:GTP-binding protein Era
MKAAVITIVGRPSAGKSTLLNRLCGQKVSIVSPNPQTTRNAIRGIVTEERGQLVIVDTPGFHLSDRKMNLKMKFLVSESLMGVDMVLYAIDSSRAPGEEEGAIAESLAAHDTPVIVALNKIDLGANPRIQEPPRPADEHGAAARELLSRVLPKAPILEVSALSGDGMPQLIDLLFERAPDGEQMYPDEFYTDQPAEFRVTEIIREKAIERVHQEVPHSLYVEVADMEMPDDTASTEGSSDDSNAQPESAESTREPRLWIRAFLVTERESQKGILVGKGGAMIKEIRVAAQKEIQAIFPYRVYLDLRVKVNPKWRKNDSTLKRLIF